MLVHNLMDFSEMGRDLPDIVKEALIKKYFPGIFPGACTNFKLTGIFYRV